MLDRTVRRLVMLWAFLLPVAGCGSRSGLLLSLELHDDGHAGTGLPQAGQFGAGAGGSVDAGVAGSAPGGTGGVSGIPDSGIPDAAAGGAPSSCAPAPDTSASHPCDLALLLDRSESMNQVRSSTGRTRCQDASRFAQKVFNFYRCGHNAEATGTCPSGTTADEPVLVRFDGTMPSPDYLYSDPKNHCATIAAKRVNVFAFGGGGGLRSLTTEISPSGWVNLSDNCRAEELVSVLEAEAAAADCSGKTPLADALCQMAPTPPIMRHVHEPTMKFTLLTDGDENASTGLCSGTDDSDGLPPFDLKSWQGKVYNAIFIGDWSVDVTLFLPASSSIGVDPETGGMLATDRARAFFDGFGNAADGRTTNVPDDGPL